MDGWPGILERAGDAVRCVFEVPGRPTSDHPAAERVGPLSISQIERQRDGEKEADEKGEDNRGRQTSAVSSDPLRDPTGVGKSRQKEPPEMVEQDVLVVMRDERAPARRVDGDNDPHIFEPRDTARDAEEGHTRIGDHSGHAHVKQEDNREDQGRENGLVSDTDQPQEHEGEADDQTDHRRSVGE